MKYSISAKRCLGVTLTALLASMSAVEVSAALNAAYYTPESTLSSGHWVKIKVKQSGMQQVTDAQLAAMGFSDPSKVAVYGYGASLLADNRLTSDTPDDLPAVPSVYTGGKLIFYGEGDVALFLDNEGGEYVTRPQRNYYSDYSIYFLTDSREPLAPAEVPLRDSYGSNVGVSYGMVHIEEELTNPGEVGARFLGPDFSAAGKHTISFAMPSYVQSYTSGRNKIFWDLNMGLLSRNSNSVKITLPSGAVSSFYVGQISTALASYSDASRSGDDDPQVSADGIYNLTIDASNLNLQYGAVDYLSVAYPRTNRLNALTEETLAFRQLNSDDRITLTNVAEGTMVWDITDRYAPRLFTLGEETATGDEGRTVYFTSPGAFTDKSGSDGAYVIAFDPEAELHSVEPVGEVAPQNLHSMTTPRMVIVASEPFMAEAQRLAEAHGRFDGKEVAVVLQDEVFNEFSSGAPHVMGIRRFARMLHDRDPRKFKSILLFGPASYDNRGFTALDSVSFRRSYIPMFQREDIKGSGRFPESYSADAFVGMLEENTGAFDIGRSYLSVAVGRIPASDLSSARSYVNKAIGYMANPPAGDYRNRALLMCDMGDMNGHMEDANGAAKEIATYAPATTIYKAYNTIYPFTNGRAVELNRVASQALSKGVAYWAYSGHATPRFFGSQQIWSITKSNEESYAVKPFVMLATCRALLFDHREENIGEAMLYNENGGAIALVGAVRQVYKEHNQKLNVQMARMFYTLSAGSTYGEIFMAARNATVPTGSYNPNNSRYYDTIYNTLSYNYIGDPELTPGKPTQTVTLTEVNGVDVAMAGVTEIEGGAMVTVSGEVLNDMMEADSSFNGTVVINLYDGAKTVNVLNVDDSSSTSDTVTLDEDLLVEQRAEVTDGRFTITFYVPEPMRAGGVNRLNLYAQASDDPDRQAQGVCNSISIVDRELPAAPGEESAPVIEAMYLDSEDFRNGDTFTSTPTLHAVVAPNVMGVTALNSQLGKSLMLFLDDKQAYTTASGYFHGDTAGGGTLEIPLTGLSDGPHTLTMRVSNNAGQMTSRTITFVMVNVHSSSEILLSDDTVDDSVVFDLANWEYDTPTARIIIKDATGATVFVDPAATFPYTWNVTDSEGAQLPEGPYTVEAMLSGGQHYGSARPVSFTVIRPL